MVKVTYAKLHKFLMEDLPNGKGLKRLKALDLKPIIADFSMSENHLGGDDLVDVVVQVMAAVEEGYKIVTWYGPNTDVLIVGVRPGTIELVE